MAEAEIHGSEKLFVEMAVEEINKCLSAPNQITANDVYRVGGALKVQTIDNQLISLALRARTTGSVTDGEREDARQRALQMLEAPAGSVDDTYTVKNVNGVALTPQDVAAVQAGQALAAENPADRQALVHALQKQAKDLQAQLDAEQGLTTIEDTPDADGTPRYRRVSSGESPVSPASHSGVDEPLAVPNPAPEPLTPSDGTDGIDTAKDGVPAVDPAAGDEAPVRNATPIGEAFPEDHFDTPDVPEAEAEPQGASTVTKGKKTK